jgi:hypothetical protein
MRLTNGTSGKLHASSTFSGRLLQSRNIGRAQSSPFHSNAEIEPPIEGLSSSRKFPAFSLTIVSDAIS